MYLDRKERAEKKAETLVEKEMSLYFYTIRLNEKDEEFQTNLQMFKLLFHQEDPDYKLALWNSIQPYCVQFDPEWMTPEERQFVDALVAACDAFYSRNPNVNKPFATDRLRLRPRNAEKDYELYYKHLKEDGDFTLFTNLKYTKENVEKFGFEMPYFFVIEEKKTGNMVGYVGLRWEKTVGEKTGVMECEYYIFKPYRGKGYAKEALSALCQRAFAGKLQEAKQTAYRYIFRNKTAKPQVIRATIRTDNLLSRGLAEACGFRHMGTLQRYYWAENRYAVDCEIYELCKE